MTRVALWVCCLVLVLGVQKGVEAQAKPDGPDVYGAKNTFGVMAEYSNDSSRILGPPGTAENVKMGAVGFEYQRRLVANRYVVFSYAVEFRPVMLQSSPTQTLTVTEIFPSGYPFTTGTYTVPTALTTRCKAGVTTFSAPPEPAIYVSQVVTVCGREMNYAEGISPFGMRFNLRPGHKLQPTFSTLEGDIISTKPLPVANAGSFNFTFDLGVGLEYYMERHRSVRLEYRVQHYSNAGTANSNPGVDNGIFKLTYSFGR